MWRIFGDMARAVKHVHDKGFVHLDIKPTNFFVTRQHRVKLGDFGKAIHVAMIDSLLDSDVEGDSIYMAPELLHKRISQKVDIFSLGATLLEIAGSINLPQNGILWTKLREEKQIQFSPSAKRSHHLEAIITNMMKPNPDERPTIDQILADPFFQSRTGSAHTFRLDESLGMRRTQGAAKTFHFTEFAATLGDEENQTPNRPPAAFNTEEKRPLNGGLDLAARSIQANNFLGWQAKSPERSRLQPDGFTSVATRATIIISPQTMAQEMQSASRKKTQQADFSARKPRVAPRARVSEFSLTGAYPPDAMVESNRVHGALFSAAKEQQPFSMVALSSPSPIERHQIERPILRSSNVVMQSSNDDFAEVEERSDLDNSSEDNEMQQERPERGPTRHVDSFKLLAPEPDQTRQSNECSYSFNRLLADSGNSQGLNEMLMAASSRDSKEFRNSDSNPNNFMGGGLCAGPVLSGCGEQVVSHLEQFDSPEFLSGRKQLPFEMAHFGAGGNIDD